MMMTKSEWDTMLQTLQHLGFQILSVRSISGDDLNKAIADTRYTFTHAEFVTHVWDVP
jgi:hypothetical protein